MRTPRLLLLAVTGPLLLGSGERPPGPAGTPPRVEAPPRAGVSPAPRGNFRAGDYVGPEACAECHEEQAARWREHPHSRMNQDAGPATVLGDFGDVEQAFPGGVARFSRRGDAWLMTLREGDVRRVYRVTRTVGSRFTQMYVGVQEEGPEPPDDPLYRQEGKLPFGWWIRRARWFPEVYFDSDCPPELGPDGTPSLPPGGTHARAPWEQHCIWCHNTYPYEARLRTRGPLTGFPAADLRLSEATPLRALPAADLVTLGISCESCHFGGRDHVEGGSIRFLPGGAGLEFPRGAREARADPRESAYVINGICAQCHCAQGVSCYPNGAGTWNARESLDLAAGSCGGALKCTDCHDPHQAGPPGGGPDRPAQVAACLRCHQDLARPDAAEDHAQHPPGTASCLDCHMPRLVQGLEEVVRTHRVGLPVEPAMLADGAPNACNLCHLERSLRWTLDALQLGWGRRLELSPAAAAANGEGERPLGLVWLGSPRPAVRLVAGDAWSRSPRGVQVYRALLRGLEDPYAVNRMFALNSVERVLGRRLSPEDYDPLAGPERRSAQVAALRAAGAR